MRGAVVRHGILIALEGIDGSGKSSLQRALAGRWRKSGWHVALWKEPTDPRLGALAQGLASRDAWGAACIFTLDRFLARESLMSKLSRNDVVLTDRSFYSTLAFQGSALAANERRALLRLQRSAAVLPDRVVLLELPERTAAGRLHHRTRRGPLERLGIQVKAGRAYRELARKNQWIVVDASLPRASVATDVDRRLRPWIELRRRARGRRR